MFVGFAKLATTLDEFLIVAWIGNLLECAANHRLRLRTFSCDHRLERIAAGNINVTAHEVDEVGSLQKQLGHPGVVVVALRNVTVAAGLCFRRAYRMRHVSIKSLTRETFGRHRLLLRIYPLAILILRADQNGA